jgi:ribosomal protein L7/L12
MQFKLTLTSYRDGETHTATFKTSMETNAAIDVIDAFFPGRYRVDQQTVIMAGNYPLSKNTCEVIAAMKRSGATSPVTCIKMIREISGAGLKEAKDAYDAI